MKTSSKSPSPSKSPSKTAVKTLTKTPRKAGFTMPAEWHPHEATWIAWPNNLEDWPGKFAPIPWIYAEIIRLLALGEKVRIFVNDTAEQRKAARFLERNGVVMEQVEFFHLGTDRVWTRDSGPSFLVSKSKVALCDWRFNAWAKYDNWKQDDKIPAYIARKFDLLSWQPAITNARGKLHRVVLEGGSIDVNGAGSLLTTEECLLSDIQQRNPGLDRKEIEKALCDYLGLEQILWLDRGIVGDDTHGHVDDTARFVSAQRIVCCVENNTADENHAPMAENLRRLKAMTNPQGEPFEIVELPLPSPVIFDGQRLPASYANFYIANAGVLVPVFNDANDRIALDILAECFKDRPVIPVYCRDLVWGLGTLHCMTQQQPSLGES